MRLARVLDPEPDVLPQELSDPEDDTSPMVDIPHVIQYPIIGTVVGIPPSDLYTNPMYGTHYLTAPIEGRVAGEYYLEVTEEMEALPAGTERVDGEDIEVTRAGTVRTRDTFKADDEELEPVSR